MGKQSKTGGVMQPGTVFFLLYNSNFPFDYGFVVVVFKFINELRIIRLFMMENLLAALVLTLETPSVNAPYIISL